MAMQQQMFVQDLTGVYLAPQKMKLMWYPAATEQKPLPSLGSHQQSQPHVSPAVPRPPLPPPLPHVCRSSPNAPWTWSDSCNWPSNRPWRTDRTMPSLLLHHLCPRVVRRLTQPPAQVADLWRSKSRHKASLPLTPSAWGTTTQRWETTKFVGVFTEL